MDAEHQMIWIGVTIQPMKWLDILIGLPSGYVQLSTKTAQVRPQETLSHWLSVQIYDLQTRSLR